MFAPNATRITNNVWLGNLASAYDKTFLNNNKITYVISFYEDFNNSNKSKHITYIHIPYTDKELKNVNMIPILSSLADFINSCTKSNRNVLVHCKRGHHRSASVVAAYLLKHSDLTLPSVLNYVRNLRPKALSKHKNMTYNLILFSSQLDSQN